LAENANWAVPVLAAFVARPQSEFKSARLAGCQLGRQYRAPQQKSMKQDKAACRSRRLVVLSADFG
jgi:hypothetical protein